MWFFCCDLRLRASPPCVSGKILQSAPMGISCGESSEAYSIFIWWERPRWLVCSCCSSNAFPTNLRKMAVERDAIGKASVQLHRKRGPWMCYARHTTPTGMKIKKGSRKREKSWTGWKRWTCSLQFGDHATSFIHTQVQTFSDIHLPSSVSYLLMAATFSLQWRWRMAEGLMPYESPLRLDIFNVLCCGSSWPGWSYCTWVHLNETKFWPKPWEFSSNCALLYLKFCALPLWWSNAMQPLCNAIPQKAACSNTSRLLPLSTSRWTLHIISSAKTCLPEPHQTEPTKTVNMTQWVFHINPQWQPPPKKYIPTQTLRISSI